MDTLSREELKALQAKCDKTRKLLAAIKQGIEFLEEKTKEIEIQAKKWEFRLTYNEAMKGESGVYEN